MVVDDKNLCPGFHRLSVTPRRSDCIRAGPDYGAGLAPMPGGAQPPSVRVNRALGIMAPLNGR